MGKNFGRVELLFAGKGTAVQKQSALLLQLNLLGIVGDRHAGELKKADGRDKGIVRGTLIRNWRQWSAVSIEEINIIAENLHVENLDPALLGPNLVFSGIENFTQLPVGTLLEFPEAILLVERENDPCTKAGKVVASAHNGVTEHAFVKAAWHRRGLVGTVKQAGLIRADDPIKVVLPD
ncbi:MAG: MOSC domain-containing protein [Leptolyngbya sp.]|nr:MOSC domain-containing protein [Candidatus Melainabacteria bacterium]